jgi:GNAT superfamily N-acetyltransferase
LVWGSIDVRYRHLAPLWVIPEFQGRGVSSLLIRDVAEIADRETPSTPMYLEAMPAAMPIYRHFGYRDVEGEGKGFVMIRYGPPKDEGEGEVEGKAKAE